MICSDLLNCIQKRWHRSHKDKKWQKHPQSYFHWVIPHKVTIFCCFNVFPHQIFQVEAKISTIRPVFPDYLLVSYDYSLIFLAPAPSMFNSFPNMSLAESSYQLYLTVTFWVWSLTHQRKVPFLPITFNIKRNDFS